VMEVAGEVAGDAEEENERVHYQWCVK